MTETTEAEPRTIVFLREEAARTSVGLFAKDDTDELLLVIASADDAEMKSQGAIALTPMQCVALAHALVHGFVNVCRVCGCSEWNPCEGGCGWAIAEGDKPLCTRCASPVPNGRRID